MFVGCGNQSFITLTSTESPARDAKAVFELDISGISGAEITAELRQNGETQSEPLISLDNIDENNYDCVIIIRAVFN